MLQKVLDPPYFCYKRAQKLQKGLLRVSPLHPRFQHFVMGCRVEAGFITLGDVEVVPADSSPPLKQDCME